MTQTYTQLTQLAEAICRSFTLEARTQDGRIIVDRGLGVFEVYVQDIGETSHQMYESWDSMLNRAGSAQDVNLKRLAYQAIWIPVEE